MPKQPCCTKTGYKRRLVTPSTLGTDGCDMLDTPTIFVLGFSGSKAEAGQIKESLETFLHDSLKLELSREKTLITHATSQAARFLGYELVNQQANDKLDRTGR